MAQTCHQNNNAISNIKINDAANQQQKSMVHRWSWKRKRIKCDVSIENTNNNNMKRIESEKKELILYMYINSPLEKTFQF